MSIKEKSLLINNFFMNYIFPPKIYNIALCFLDFLLHKVIKYSMNHNYVKKINIKTPKKEVFILANGPSLSQLNLQGLVDKDVITMNCFHRHEDSLSIKSIYHVVAEPGKNIKEVNYIDVFNPATKRHLFHLNSKSAIEKKFRNSIGSNVHYFTPAVSTIDQYCGDKFDFSGSIPRPRNSAQLAIMLAMYLDYKKIYLLGVDEDQMSNSAQFNTHFYKDSKEDIENSTSTMSYLNRLIGKSKTFMGFSVINKVAKGMGVEIINLNKLSMLDEFDFADPKNVIGRKNEG